MILANPTNWHCAGTPRMAVYRHSHATGNVSKSIPFYTRRVAIRVGQSSAAKAGLICVPLFECSSAQK